MDARFARAARHSRWVRILRVAVPGMVAVSLAAILAVSIFNPFRVLQGLPVDVSGMVVSGTKITMESPHLAGFSSDQRPYEIWANTATQDITVPDKIDLTIVHSKFLTEDQSIVTIEGQTGLFDTKSQILDLRKDVLMRTSEGYEVRLDQATIDTVNGAVSTDDGVNVKMASGTVRADRLRLTDKGDVIRFEGNVVMHLMPDRPVDTTAATPIPPTPPPPPAPPPPRAASASKARSPSSKRVDAR